MTPPRLSLAFAIATFASVVSAQTTVIFLGTGNGADPAIQTFLESRYGKANVKFQTTEPAGTVKKETILGYDVAVLSSTPSSGRYRGILHDSTTPIVNLEEAVADNTPATGEFSVTAGRTKETEIAAHSIKITTAHPITAGFKVGATVKFTTAAAEVWWSTGQQATGASSLATDDDTATNLFVTIVDQGGNLLNNTKAPCRRVMFGCTDNSFNFFTVDAKKIFGQAVDWAADACCAQQHNYGVGSKGTNGIPTLTASGDPKFNAKINVLVSNSSGKANACMLFLGLQPISVRVDGGIFLVNPLFQAPLAIPANGLTIPYTVPNLAPLCTAARLNLRFYLQVLQLDTGAVKGVSFTPGLRLRFGN